MVLGYKASKVWGLELRAIRISALPPHPPSSGFRMYRLHRVYRVWVQVLNLQNMKNWRTADVIGGRRGIGPADVSCTINPDVLTVACLTFVSTDSLATRQTGSKHHCAFQA